MVDHRAAPALAEGIGNGVLLRHWQQLGATDRRAILAALSPEHRAQFEALLAESGAEQNDTRRQFAAYSHWLGRMVESCVEGDNHFATVLAEPVRRSLCEGHARMLREKGEGTAAVTPLARLRAVAQSAMARL